MTAPQRAAIDVAGGRTLRLVSVTDADVAPGSLLLWLSEYNVCRLTPAARDALFTALAEMGAVDTRTAAS